VGVRAGRRELPGEDPPRGTHAPLAGAGRCTRYELAAEVLCLAGLDTPLEPVIAATFPTRAARPANSVLDCSKAAGLGVRMPDWRDAVARFLAERVGDSA
jgi:dTDP-4-dehydrorhamnose reductase